MDWLVPPQQRIPTPNTHRAHGYTCLPVELVVLHYTVGGSGLASARWLCRPEAKASAHFVLERDGTILQLAPLSDRTWHAGGGSSRWNGLVVNSRSVGIEIANMGALNDAGAVLTDAYGRRYTGQTAPARLELSDQPVPYGRALVEQLRRYGRADARPGAVIATTWEPYPDAQLAAVRWLLAALGEQFPALRTPSPGALGRVVAHAEVDPNRKIDPGPLFPMDQARRWVEEPA